ncbi:hypothetical protein [Enterococcus faecium]|uniref:hypothetical protein n=1 Tax=Enterococcus faecium TaxID=1352 RepID=UPI001F2083B4|nr:hypothetical protein [Enterococcus faecium]
MSIFPHLLRIWRRVIYKPFSTIKSEYPIEVTNDNIRPTNNSYTFDSSILESQIKNKESDPIAESLQLNDHKYQNMSVIFSNPAINSLQLSNMSGKPALVVTLNKEDSIWKINTVEYGY